MHTQRSIQTIEYAATFNMGGFPVRQAFPTATIADVNPFLLLHHAHIQVPEHANVLHAGVGPHPHRGFSPVTFIFKGGVHHRDSRGNNHVVYEGGIQWMNAGSGIIHSERPPANIHEYGGVQEVIQLWVNTPAKHKMDAPAYFPLDKQAIPVITSPDQLTTINVVSGSLAGINGKVPTQTEVNTFTIHMQAGGNYYFPLPITHLAFVYVLSGAIEMDATTIQANHVVTLDTNGSGCTIRALENSVLLMGSGLPIDEPVASHGPFVMNSQTELLQAFKDYQMGKMGVLIEE